MKHNYDTDQLKAAHRVAAQQISIEEMHTTKYLSSFLDALPDPQDDWIECTFEDIQKGDRVRMVQAARTTDFHLPVIETYPTFLVFQDNTQCSNFHKAVYYRIPTLVVAPDPAEHPVIIVHDAMILNPRQSPLPMIWFDDAYVGGGYHMQPESITSWTPAKVVETND